MSPLILTLAGAIVGALIDAYANGRYRDWQDKKAREQERKGLLLLVDSEVYTNEAFIRVLKRPATLFPNLRIDIWDKAQVRLAQLLPVDDTRLLVTYDSLIQILPETDIAQEAEFTQHDKEIIEDIKTTGKEVRDLIRSYGIEAPDFPELQDEGIDEDSAK